MMRAALFPAVLLTALLLPQSPAVVGAAESASRSASAALTTHQGGELPVQNVAYRNGWRRGYYYGPRYGYRPYYRSYRPYNYYRPYGYYTPYRSYYYGGYPYGGYYYGGPGISFGFGY
jgi:hypothetical protein